MSDADAIAARRGVFLNLFNAQDIAGMADFVTGDCCGMPPNQPAVLGVEGHRAWWAQSFEAGRAKLSVDSQELIVTGDTAFDRFNFTMEVTPPGGETMHDAGKCVWMWRREPDGAWRVTHSIWNSDNPAGGPW
jgi:ketosteroid isomerase-like protein